MDVVVPLWAWLALAVAIAAMLAVDLFLHRDNHVVGFREAAIWSGVWVAAGVAFGVLLWGWQGQDVAGTYFAGYLLEKALSIDNVFVFALIFTTFAVPARYQHKVLFYGVIGALVFRLVFVFLGAELLERFWWTALVFGGFLLYTAYKMAFRHGLAIDVERNLLVRAVRRVLPTHPEYDEGRFVTRRNGRRMVTLLFIVLVAVEGTDLIFAIDSVAAILAITTSTFIVWTANAFAVLGLRSLYFCLAGLLDRFRLLHYGLAVLLGFAGVKLILSETPVGKLPVWLTLAVIATTITVSIVWSMAATKGREAAPSAAPSHQPDGFASPPRPSALDGSAAEHDPATTQGPEQGEPAAGQTDQSHDAITTR